GGRAGGARPAPAHRAQGDAAMTDRPGRDDPDPSTGDPAVPGGSDPSPDDPVASDHGAESDVVGVRRVMFGVRDTGDTSGYGGLVLPTEVPGVSSRPSGSYFDAVVGALVEALDARGGLSFDEAVAKVIVHAGQLTLH